MDTEVDLLQWLLFFYKNTAFGSCIKLHKPIIRKFKKLKIYSSFIDADFTDMQLISKFNKGFHFLLCVVDIYSK